MVVQFIRVRLDWVPRQRKGRQLAIADLLDVESIRMGPGMALSISGDGDSDGSDERGAITDKINRLKGSILSRLSRLHKCPAQNRIRSDQIS